LGFLVSLASRESVEKELPNKIVRFYTIYLLLFTGLMGMVVTGDVFNLYVFLEIASLAAYALIALGEDGAPLASFNYIILGTIGACLYLLGVGYLYIVTGSLNIADLARLLPPLYSSKVVRMALAFFLIGLFIKMGVFPLHVWLPDAYTYAPSAVSALIAPLMTKVAAYVLMRIVFTVFDPAFSLRPFPFGLILGWLAAAGILVGSVLAIAQSDFKRMLAYSSVSQMGYILLGISLANVNGFTGALLHILNHGFMKAVLFLVAAALMYKAGSRNIYRLSGLHRKMPLTSAALAVGALSMVGIPPTCGFFSKWYLLLGSLEANLWPFAVIILASSLLTAVYFFRVVEIILLGRGLQPDAPPQALPPGKEDAPLSMLIPLCAMALGLILLGLFNEKIVSGVILLAVPSKF
jgi:multicomponent Na+:H+ antiporter subunit D